MKVGSLVECIENFESSELGITYPELNTPYVVRTILSHDGETGITLEEIINEPKLYKQGFNEKHFNIKKFRELQPPLDLSELLEEKVTA